MSKLRTTLSQLYTAALTTGKPKKATIPGITIKFKRREHCMSVEITGHNEFPGEKKISMIDEAMPFPARHVEDDRFAIGHNYIVVIHYPIQEILC